MNYSNGTVGIWVSPATGNGTFQFSTSGWGITNASNTWKNSAKVRFVDFLNWTVPLLGGAVNGQTSIDASSWPYATTSGGEPLNMAQFTKTASVGEVYKSRMYLAGDPDYTNGSRLFFSSVVSSNRGITWTPSTDYVDINPGDGEAITGLKRYSLELLVFKPNYTYRFRTSGLDPDPLIRVGTRSQESVIEGKRGVYFHHDTGFYRYSGSYPIEISRPIIDVIEAIPASQYDDIAGWKDNDHIYWSIGNVSLSEPQGKQTWKNVVVRYTESSDIWTIYTYPLEITRGSPFLTATSSSIVVGTINGIINEFNKGLTDFGEPIKYRTVTKWYELEGIENQKFIDLMAAIAEKGQGMNVMYQINNYEDWITLTPDLRKFITYFDKSTKKFNRIRFKVAGVTSTESSVFMGFEILSGINNGIVKNYA